MKPDEARELLVSIAHEDAGKIEVTRNRAPWIKKYWPDTSYPDGYDFREPYCAAFTSYVLAEFIRRLAAKGELRETLGMGLVQANSWRCKDARAFGWRDWAAKKRVRLIADTGKPLMGDFVVYDFSHIGIVEWAEKGVIGTVEANTNSLGGREGDGCWTKTRNQSLAQCFVRVLP